MKAKSARRFIQRNRVAMVRDPSRAMIRNMRKCYRALSKDSRNPASLRILVRDYVEGKRGNNYVSA